MVWFKRRQVEQKPIQLPKVEAREQFAGTTFLKGRTEEDVNVAVLVDSQPEETRIVIETVGDFYYGSKTLDERASTSSQEVQAGVTSAFNEAGRHHSRLRHNFSQFHSLSDFVEPLYVLHAQLVGNTYHHMYTHGGHRRTREGSGGYAAILDGENNIIGRVFRDVQDFDITARMSLPERDKRHEEPQKSVPLVELVHNVRYLADVKANGMVVLHGKESDIEDFEDRMPRIVIDVGRHFVGPERSPGKKAVISSGTVVNNRHLFYEVSPWYGPLPMLTDILRLVQKYIPSVAQSSAIFGGLNKINKDNVARFAYEVILRHQ